jgi:hypothetical protein
MDLSKQTAQVQIAMYIATTVAGLAEWRKQFLEFESRLIADVAVFRAQGKESGTISIREVVDNLKKLALVQETISGWMMTALKKSIDIVDESAEFAILDDQLTRTNQVFVTTMDKWNETLETARAYLEVAAA